MTSAQPTESVFRLIRTPAYLILTMAMVLPLIDYANGLFPLHLGDPVWRFGALGLIASYTLATTAQLFFLFVIATGAGDRRVLMAIAVVAFVSAIALLLATGVYFLDTIQTRARTSADTQTRLELAAAVVLLKFVCLLVADLVLARASIRARSRLSGAALDQGEPMLLRRSVPVAVPKR